MTAFYNELDPYPAAWLRNLIAGSHIADGVVDERSICDLGAADVAGPGQRHFFAGLGAWSHALRLAGVPDDADVWTGSCPCQPFSQAGKRQGTTDARHLWPVWFELIAECRPAIVFGEQVAGRAGRDWLSGVRADLEGAGYAVGAADLAAASVGAPHIRQRIFFGAYRLADRNRARRALLGAAHDDDRDHAPGHDSHRRGAPDGLADDGGHRRQDRFVAGAAPRPTRRGGTNDGAGSGLRDASSDGAREHAGQLPGDEGEHAERSAHGDHAPRVAGPTLPGPWSDAEWILCTDGVARPAQPGSFPLAPRTANRVGRLRAYGNALVPQAAAAFVRAFLEAVTALPV